MEKQRKQRKNKVKVDHELELMKAITMTVVEYCVKSEEKVDLIQVAKAESQVLASTIANMTEGWTQEQEKEAIARIYCYVIDKYKIFKDTLKEVDDSEINKFLSL